MQFKDKHGNWDWWIIVGVSTIVFGALPVVYSLFSGSNLFASLILWGIEVLIGKAFIRESFLVFNIIRWLIILSILFLISGFIIDPTRYGFAGVEISWDGLDSLLSFVNMIFFIMLWRKLRLEKKISW